MAGSTRRWGLAAATLVVLALPAAASAAVQPFGKLTCVPDSGVRYCAGSVSNRIPSFDGVPLDVDVALPASGDTNLPLIILLHGYGNSKADNVANAKKFAARGYAAIAYTARGFGQSCGSAQSRLMDPAGCAKGWIKLADTRYEVRDSQYLAGLLADEGIIDPQKIGATGSSYGGGQSMALATLKDRVMNADGTLSQWKSPGGKPLRIEAAAPVIPWSDLVYSLVPNGRTLDYVVSNDSLAPPSTAMNSDLLPGGVEKQSFVSGLYALGVSSGYYAPPGLDSEADVTSWFATINAGEPYDGNPQIQNIVQQIARFHSSYYLPTNEAPAPLLIQNGFTDDLFPPDEALRYYNRLRTLYPSSPIKLQFLDIGHMRGQNKAGDTAARDAVIADWFDYYIKGTGSAPALDVTARTQTCPKSAPSGGPFSAPTWDALHPGEVRQLFPAAQTILSAGGDPNVNKAVDPIAGGGACATTPSGDLEGTATYRFAPVAGPGYTLLGSPYVQGNFAVQGTNAQIAARLWDVPSGGGEQTLVARGLYRPAGSGTEVFQLHANGYRFAPGHVAKLELLGNDAPYGRASNGAFQITATNVDLRLPVHELPGTTSQIGSPAALAVPRGGKLAPGVMRLHVSLRYHRARRLARGAAKRCWTTAAARLGGQGLRNVRRADFIVGRKRVKRDRRSPFTAAIRRSVVLKARSRRLRVGVLSKDGRRITLRRKLAGCTPPRRPTAHA